MKRILICILVLLVGCAKVQQQPTLIIKGRVAIAPFNVPKSPNEVITGYIAGAKLSVSKETLEKLDDFLMKSLVKNEQIEIIPKNFVKQCEEILTHREKMTFLNPVQKWQNIGKCIPADFIVIPQLLFFKERIGGEWGVEEPAKVMLSLNLIDVSQGKLLKTYLYKEEQQALLENMLTIKKFIKRKGKWVTAMELAQEGIIQGVKELGL